MALECVPEIYETIRHFRLTAPATLEECSDLKKIIEEDGHNFHVERYLQIDFPDNADGYSFVQLVSLPVRSYSGCLRLSAAGCRNGRYFLHLLISDTKSEIMDALQLLCLTFQINPIRPWVTCSPASYFSLVTKSGYTCDQTTGRILPPPRGRIEFYKQYKKDCFPVEARRLELFDKLKGVPLCRDGIRRPLPVREYRVDISRLPASGFEIEACRRIIAGLEHRLNERLMIQLPENAAGMRSLQIYYGYSKEGYCKFYLTDLTVETDCGEKVFQSRDAGKCGVAAAVRSVLIRGTYAASRWYLRSGSPVKRRKKDDTGWQIIPIPIRNEYGKLWQLADVCPVCKKAGGNEPGQTVCPVCGWQKDENMSSRRFWLNVLAARIDYKHRGMAADIWYAYFLADREQELRPRTYFLCDRAGKWLVRISGKGIVYYDINTGTWEHLFDRPENNKMETVYWDHRLNAVFPEEEELIQRQLLTDALRRSLRTLTVMPIRQLRESARSVSD